MEIKTASAWVLSLSGARGKDSSLGKREPGPSRRFFIGVCVFLGTLGFDLGAVGCAEGCYVAAQGDSEETAGL